MNTLLGPYVPMLVIPLELLEEDDDATDPGLEPTREVRKRISREHANEPRRLVEYYMEYQRRFADRLRWAPAPDRESKDAAEDANPAGDAPPRGR